MVAQKAAYNHTKARHRKAWWRFSHVPESEEKDDIAQCDACQTKRNCIKEKMQYKPIEINEDHVIALTLNEDICSQTKDLTEVYTKVEANIADGQE
ncbi:hypothetical protein EYF80_030919 [Liparis tanakae]|uniref:Uncharacterized protein n=1 Tax=Liparis tanakae TaxID=230148 RepID=A0A4Z2GZ94_9TELE|nr:hypothetical protein EYF80_030919 [Liparis tanakae]